MPQHRRDEIVGGRLRVVDAELEDESAQQPVPLARTPKVDQFPEARVRTRVLGARSVDETLEGGAVRDAA